MRPFWNISSRPTYQAEPSYFQAEANIHPNPNALGAAQSRLIGHLRRVLPRTAPRAVFRPDNLKNFEINWTSRISATVDYKDATIDTRWHINVDPYYKREIQSTYDDYRSTLGEYSQPAVTHPPQAYFAVASRPPEFLPFTTQQISTDAQLEAYQFHAPHPVRRAEGFLIAMEHSTQSRNAFPSGLSQISTDYLNLRRGRVTERVSYSSSGLSIRPASPAERSAAPLIGRNGRRYDLNIYVDIQLRDRLRLHSGTAIGAGENGTIHLARADNGGMFALKKFRTFEEAQQEYDNYLKLGNGPHFITAHDFIVAGNNIYIALDLVVGRNGRDFIDDVFSNSSLSLQEKKEQIVSGINQELDALYAFHARGFMHNDIHRGNFLHQDDDDLVLICDLHSMTELNPTMQFAEYMGMGYEINRTYEHIRDRYGVVIPEIAAAVQILNTGNIPPGGFIPAPR